MPVCLGLLEDEQDTELFVKLYEKEQRRMYAVARKQGLRGMDAEDAVQNGFARLAGSFHRYRRFPYGALVRLLTVIVRNAARDIARRNRRETPVESERISGQLPASEDAMEAALKNIRLEELTQALMRLSEEDRTLLQLRYYMDLTPAGIARVLGRSPGAVRTALSRARGRLLKEMEKERPSFK